MTKIGIGLIVFAERETTLTHFISEGVDSYLESGDYDIEEKPDGSKVRKLNAENTKKLVLKLCEHGILILDEFDKIRFSSENEWEGVYKKNIQYELLKIIEGAKGIGENAVTQEIDTTNILVIAMGAFTDLLNPPPEPVPIGFSAAGAVAPEPKGIDGIPTTEQICNYGFVEELVGRLPLRCRYNALSVQNLYKILKESEVSPVRDFEDLFYQTDNKLQISDSAMREIARQAHEINTGARGLRTVLGKVLYPILYDVDSIYKNHCIQINKDTVCGGKPVITRLKTNRDILREIDENVFCEK